MDAYLITPLSPSAPQRALRRWVGPDVFSPPTPARWRGAVRGSGSCRDVRTA